MLTYNGSPHQHPRLPQSSESSLHPAKTGSGIKSRHARKCPGRCFCLRGEKKENTSKHGQTQLRQSVGRKCEAGGGGYLAFFGVGRKLITEDASVSSCSFTPASGGEAQGVCSHNWQTLKNASGNPPEGKTRARSSEPQARSFRRTFLSPEETWKTVASLLHSPLCPSAARWPF